MGVFRQPPPGGRPAGIPALSLTAAAVLLGALALALLPAAAGAKPTVVKGSNGGERLTGSNGPDRIVARGRSSPSSGSARVTPVAGPAYDNRGAHVVGMRWGRIVSLHAYEDSQAVAKAFAHLREAGVEEADAAPIVS